MYYGYHHNPAFNPNISLFPPVYSQPNFAPQSVNGGLDGVVPVPAHALIDQYLAPNLNQFGGFAPAGMVGDLIGSLGGIAGTAIGSALLPGVGTAIGGAFGSTAGKYIQSVLPFNSGGVDASAVPPPVLFYHYPVAYQAQRSTFVPQGAVGDLLSQLSPQIGNTVGSFIHPQIGGQIGGAIGTALGTVAQNYLPFSAQGDFAPQSLWQKAWPFVKNVGTITSAAATPFVAQQYYNAYKDWGQTPPGPSPRQQTFPSPIAPQQNSTAPIAPQSLGLGTAATYYG